MSAALQQAMLDYGQAMLDYGQAIRGDWSGFDGRSERAVITGWVAEMRNPNPTHDLLWFRRNLGLCEAGGGHWCGSWHGYCDAECGCPCVKAGS